MTCPQCGAPMDVTALACPACQWLVHGPQVQQLAGQAASLAKEGRFDDRRSLLWFAPRKPKSAWSGPTQRRIEALEAVGLMHESGQAKVDEARRHGLWHKPDAA